MALSEPVAIEKKSSLGYIAAFTLHTYVALLAPCIYRLGW